VSEEDESRTKFDSVVLLKVLWRNPFKDPETHETFMRLGFGRENVC